MFIIILTPPTKSGPSMNTGVYASYCGWTKSCTTWKPWETICALVFTGESSFQGFLGGAGFRPFTVGHPPTNKYGSAPFETPPCWEGVGALGWLAPRCSSSLSSGTELASTAESSLRHRRNPSIISKYRSPAALRAGLPYLDLTPLAC